MNNLFIAAFIVVIFFAGFAVGQWTYGQQVPNCQEDEVIYYDDYPDGNLICLHVDTWMDKERE